MVHAIIGLSVAWLWKTKGRNAPSGGANCHEMASHTPDHERHSRYFHAKLGEARTTMTCTVSVVTGISALSGTTNEWRGAR